MRPNRLRQAWAEGRAVTNVWVSLGGILPTEILAHQGWDSLTIDMQHGQADFAGVVAGSFDHAQLNARTVLRRTAVAAMSGGDIFADPDDASPSALLRVLLLSILTDAPAEQAKLAATELLPGADLLAPAEETAGGPAVRAAVLALRFEMTAVYLGLATGALGGPGRHAAVPV